MRPRSAAGINRYGHPLLDKSYCVRQRPLCQISRKQLVPSMGQRASARWFDISNAGRIAPVVAILGGRDPQATVAVIAAEAAGGGHQRERGAKVDALIKVGD